MSNALLDDFLAEAHNEAIERGNLKRKSPTWKEPPQVSYKPAGAVLRVASTPCWLCGEISTSPIGLFSRLVSPSGAVVDTAISPDTFNQYKERQILETNLPPSLCKTCFLDQTL